MQIDNQCMRLLFVVSILILHGCAVPRERLRYITGTKAKVEKLYQDSLTTSAWNDTESQRISCEDVYMYYHPWVFKEIILPHTVSGMDCKFAYLGNRYIKYLENVTGTQGQVPVLYCNCTHNEVTSGDLWLTVEKSTLHEFHIMKTEDETGYFELEEREEVDNEGRALFRPCILLLYDKHSNLVGNRTANQGNHTAEGTYHQPSPSHRSNPN